MNKKFFLIVIIVLFSIQSFSQSITVTFPNGGEHFSAGVQAPHNIIWTDSYISLFNVYYSVDNGSSWISIATDVSDNFYSWTPPAEFSDLCLIKVTDNNEIYSDESDANFSIVELHNYFAEWNTNHGVFRIMLHNDLVPITTQNFMNLAERNFYDNLIFHRVIEGFMIQDGCPLGNGTGGPGYDFNDEFVPQLTHEHPGVLSMANAGPNTNGSQYFITVDQTSWLDNHHTVFGRVIDDMNIVYEISEVPVDGSDKPIDDVIIYSVTISDAMPELAVTFPQGGESFIESYTIPITWESDFIPDVKIEFSDDNGSSWLTLIDSIPADIETFDWEVTGEYSNECLIKFSDINNDTLIAISNLFEIRVKPIKVARIEFFEGVEPNSENLQNLIMLGKPLRFRVQLVNDLSENLIDIGVKLTTSDAFSTVTIDSINISDISEGETVWSSDYFEILLPENYPNSGNIPIQLSVDASNVDDTLWITDYSIPVLKRFSFFTIDDDNNPDSQGNGNQTIEPGETAEAQPSIDNSSPDTCYQVYARLTSTVNCIDIWNGVQGADRIVYDTTRVNNFQPLLPHTAVNLLENDFVFDYNASGVFYLPLTVELYGYLIEDAGVDWQHGGIKAGWGINLDQNTSSPVNNSTTTETESFLKILNTNNKLNISFLSDVKSNTYNVVIYDLNGKIIYSETVNYSQSNVYQLNNRQLPVGIYFVNVKASLFNISGKFFVVE